MLPCNEITKTETYVVPTKFFIKNVPEVNIIMWGFLSVKANFSFLIPHECEIAFFYFKNSSL